MKKESISLSINELKSVSEQIIPAVVTPGLQVRPNSLIPLWRRFVVNVLAVTCRGRGWLVLNKWSRNKSLVGILVEDQVFEEGSEKPETHVVCPCVCDSETPRMWWRSATPR